MSVWSMLFFILAVFYIVGGILEFPIMFDGNPKTRFLISKIGKKNLKIMIFVFAVIFIILAVILR